MQRTQSLDARKLGAQILQELAEYYSDYALCCAFDACRDPARWVRSTLGIEVQSLPVRMGNMQFVEIRRRWSMPTGQGSERMLLLRPCEAEVMEYHASEGCNLVQLCKFWNACRNPSALPAKHYAHESNIYSCPPCKLDFDHHEPFKRHLRFHRREMMTVWVSPFLNNTRFSSADAYEDHLLKHFEARFFEGMPLASVKDEWSQDRVVQDLLCWRKLAIPVLEHLKWICDHRRAKYTTNHQWLKWSASHADIIIECLQHGIQEHAKDDFVHFVCRLVCKARRARQREQGLDPNIAAPSLSFMARHHGSSATADAISAMLSDPSSLVSRQGIFRSFCLRPEVPELGADMSPPEHLVEGDPDFLLNYLPPSNELFPTAMMAANDIYNVTMSTFQSA